jgi:hypothetical protein
MMAARYPLGVYLDSLGGSACGLLRPRHTPAEGFSDPNAEFDDLGIEAATSVDRILDYRPVHFWISWMPKLHDSAP